jgi:hypothetical protein
MKDNSRRYCLEYTGPNVFDPEHVHSNFYRITIGRSKADLQPFLNRHVLVRGRFVQGDHQCILRQCVSLGGQMTVLDISSIRLH